ncbi:MAG: sugar MFS transporter [Bacteroidales bacterium]|nr:sugar MFS transporter [Bacteroidales bacterium]
MPDSTSKSSRYSLVLLTSLFFMWGFITVLNDILIPHLKAVFELTYLEAMLVQFAFFGAYFIGGLLYFLISMISGDPISKIGYKNGIIIGLLMSALGTILFYPAAHFQFYGFFLAALFVLGLGFAMLQIAANPYVAILGPEASASSRLNLSQGFNSFGTTIGPILGGFFIFEYFKNTANGADSVVVPYMVLTAMLLLLAIAIKGANLPRFVNVTHTIKGAGALKFRQLRLGAIAIFLYVGAEVAIGSFLISYLGLEKIAGFTEADASPFVSFYWGGAMIGRFLGAISLSAIDKKKKYTSMLFVSVLAFSIVYLAIYLKTGISFEQIFPYIVFLLLNYFAFIIGRSMPGRTLSIFALAPIALLLVGIFGSHLWAMWAILGIGIFNSIMWSNIFTMAIKGLGDFTSQGSSILVMFIVGGAILPPIQGAVADLVGVQLSFFVPMLSYIYLAYYGWRGHLAK